MLQISPELVLVDPELASVERLRLAEAAEAGGARDSGPAVLYPLPRSITVPTAVPSGPPEPRAGRQAVAGVARTVVERAMPTLFVLSLFLNLLFAGALFAGNSDAPTLEPAPQTAVQPPRTTSSRPVSQPATKAEAEQAALRLAQQRASAGLLPKLTDPTTGLLKNNVQAVCRGAGAGSFLCVLRGPDRRGKGVYLRYRRLPGGVSAVTWLGYRSR